MRYFDLDETDFANQINHVLSPRSAIKNPHLLKGREKELSEVVRELKIRGTNAFIHGLRGVGKTSLAYTAATEYINSLGEMANHTIVDSVCQNDSSFESIIQNLFSKAVGEDPTVTGYEVKSGLNIGFNAFGGQKGKNRNHTPIPQPKDVNNAIEILRFIENKNKKSFIFIIDEFDQIEDEKAHYNFGLFAKQLSEQDFRSRFIYVGVGTDLAKLFKAHESSLRYFHSWSLNRLRYQSLLDIADQAFQHFEIDIESTSRYRIAQISDGFPYFTHLLCQKLLNAIYDYSGKKERIDQQVYMEAIPSAISSVEQELLNPYKDAVQKNKRDGELILWAVADGSDLERLATDVYSKSYLKIHKMFYEGIDEPPEPLSLEQFRSRVGVFCQSTHSCILERPRRAWISFKEKRMRGLARLKAAEHGIRLFPDHPLG